jgi:hypothetical protein
MAKMTPERRAALIAELRESERQFEKHREEALQAIAEMRLAAAMRRRRRWWPFGWR